VGRRRQTLLKVGHPPAHSNDPKVLLEVSEDLQGAMKGLAVAGLDEASMLQTRGW
jgi:pyridoxal 5'-phosphate synthase pdxS subunit